MTGPTKLWVPTQSFRAWSVRVTNWSLQLKIPWRAEHVSFHAQRSHIFLSNISLSTTNNTNSTCLDFADKTPKKHAKTHLSIPALCCISFSPSLIVYLSNSLFTRIKFIISKDISFLVIIISKITDHII